MSGNYVPPLRDMQFVMHELLDMEGVLARTCSEKAIDRETADQVLDGAGRFCAEVLAPLNPIGDLHGCQFDAGNVKTAPGFREAYSRYATDGWSGLVCDVDDGGQGLPQIVGTAVSEMLASSNSAWSLYPKLSEGAYRCIRANGSAWQKATFLSPLATGEWTGTMCLTEPHCGTDLGLLRTRAVPNDDGSFAITGTKIFISSGEHDLASNIVHLVLARLPDAAPGVRGISLFIVPKFLLDPDGKPATRNGVQCGSLERKMGIHGNATCVMNFEAATGYLIGEPGKGLPAMFVMMNGARLGTGTQAMGLSETAYQRALRYSQERLQSRAPMSPAGSTGPDPIILLPDVRRMLLTQRALVEGGRAFAYWLALQIDIHHNSLDAQVAQEAEGLLALLTPVAKAFLTDNGVEVTSLGMQVHGGAGFITETGAEQLLRDARILPIYEGTNGVQANDLVSRKVLADGARVLRKLLAIVRESAGQCLAHEEGTSDNAVGDMGRTLAQLCDDVEAETQFILDSARIDPCQPGTSSAAYLRLIGHLMFAHFWARTAIVASTKVSDSFYAGKLATAQFYFACLLPESRALLPRIRVESSAVMNPLAFAA